MRSKPRLNRPMIRLYDVPQRQGAIINYVGVKMEFDHIDGMYSYCTILEGKSKGKIFHLSAATPLVEVGENEYEVPEQ